MKAISANDLVITEVLDEGWLMGIDTPNNGREIAITKELALGIIRLQQDTNPPTGHDHTGQEVNRLVTSIVGATTIHDEKWRERIDGYEKELLQLIEAEASRREQLARTQGWHEGRASVTAPNVQYNYTATGGSTTELKSQGEQG